jgi:septum site-determining protein MinC
MLRGSRGGLELFFDDRPFEEALRELEDHVTQRPEFYRGTSALIVFARAPQPVQVSALLEVLAAHGVTPSGLAGPAECQALAESVGLPYAARQRRGDASVRRARQLAERSEPVVLSNAARSLVADFEGARKDRVLRRPAPSIRAMAAPASLPVPQATPTLYHSGTLRGGQALAYAGNVVIVGDVNPGAEVVAGADIVIFGTLRGVAHAGAQGDTGARVFALELAPTQLRIASRIAADFQAAKKRQRAPECALIIDERICVVPHDRARNGQREAVH